VVRNAALSAMNWYCWRIRKRQEKHAASWQTIVNPNAIIQARRNFSQIITINDGHWGSISLGRKHSSVKGQFDLRHSRDGGRLSESVLLTGEEHEREPGTRAEREPTGLKRQKNFLLAAGASLILVYDAAYYNHPISHWGSVCYGPAKRGY